MFSNSMLGEILQLISRTEVKALVHKHKGDRYRKSFKTWDHLVALLVGQLSGSTSLRDLEVTLNAHPFLHYHLGIKGVSRSTLSDANNSRGFHLFRDMAFALIAHLGRSREELGQILTILDSSLIRLASRGHGWAKGTRDHNTGLKLHVQYDWQNDVVEYVEVGDANINDVTVAHQIPLQPHRIYVFDKGYCDYNWWKDIADKNSFFVTRLKKNAAYTIIKTNIIADEDKGFILKDHLINLSNKHPRGGKKNTLSAIPLRLVEIRHPSGKETPFHIVTNACQASAQSIAGWYKARWSIELLFKWLKQNLKIKRFLGENRNAIMIQIYVAIIAYVLLKLYQREKHLIAMRLKDIAVLARANLFTRTKFFLHTPEKTKPPPKPRIQLSWGF